MKLRGVTSHPAQRPKLQMNARSKLANGMAAASLAFALAGNPMLNPVSAAEPAVVSAARTPRPNRPHFPGTADGGMSASPHRVQVEQYGMTLRAEVDDLRPAQERYLEERAKMKTEYERDVKTSYKTLEETEDKRSTYTTVVVGLLVVAVVAPMISFFYYTGGE